MGFPKFIGRLLKPSRAVAPATQTAIPAVKTAESLPAIVKPITVAEPVVSTVKPVVQAYQIQHLPGYQLKSLMSGNPLEKQLSKTGTISTASIDALSKKMSAVEQAVIGKVLTEKFPGQKVIDYNDFRKDVQDELITYDRTPNTKWADYGTAGLGFRLRNGEQDVQEDNAITKFLSYLENHPEERNIWPLSFDARGFHEPASFGPERNYTISEIDAAYPGWRERFNYPKKLLELDTYTFSSPRIPHGSDKHYNANTLGHSRTYTTADEPDVLHVMESQSDWAQSGKASSAKKAYQKNVERLGNEYLESRKRVLEKAKSDVETWKKMMDTGLRENGEKLEPYEIAQVQDYYLSSRDRLARLETEMPDNYVNLSQAEYLSDNFTSRQIQENLRYAAEKGQTKMRYPTRETAAKIEGYPEREAYYDASGKDVTTDKSVDLFDYHDNGRLTEINNKESEIRSQMDYLQSELGEGEEKADAQRLMAELDSDLSKLMKEKRSIIDNAELKPGFTKKVVYDNENILKRYSEFPKQFGKLFKGAPVRTTQDLHGNTGYEVDVPKDYLQMEWPYKEGGSIPSVFEQGGILKGQKGLVRLLKPITTKLVAHNIKLKHPGLIKSISETGEGAEGLIRVGNNNTGQSIFYNPKLVANVDKAHGSGLYGENPALRPAASLIGFSPKTLSQFGIKPSVIEMLSDRASGYNTPLRAMENLPQNVTLYKGPGPKALDFIGHGLEHEVFIGPDGKSVTKFRFHRNPSTFVSGHKEFPNLTDEDVSYGAHRYPQSILEFIPERKYVGVGLSDNGRQLVPVFEENFIKGVHPSSTEEMADAFKRYGISFDTVGGGQVKFDNGFIAKDIKPDNVILVNGKPIITDPITTSITNPNSRYFYGVHKPNMEVKKQGGLLKAQAGKLLPTIAKATKSFSKPAIVKYYGPTMGKTFAAKINPLLIDLDTYGMPEYNKLAQKYGYKDGREMILSDKGDYNTEYKQLIKDQIARIQADPQYNGRTIIVSNASLLNPNSGITFAAPPIIPSRDIMAARNHERHPGESVQHGLDGGDSLGKKGTPLKIDDRFVSELEPMPTDAQGDALYNAAIESGNMEEVQRLRDMHFLSKAEDTPIVNDSPFLFAHTTPNDFTIFDKKNFGRTDEGYHGKGFYLGGTSPVDMKTFKYPQLTFKGRRPIHNYGKNKKFLYVKGVPAESTSEYNYFEDPRHLIAFDTEYPIDKSFQEFIVGHSEQMKLADPITYDDTGKIIPLSKRDDFTNPDIRYGVIPLIGGLGLLNIPQKEENK